MKSGVVEGATVEVEGSGWGLSCTGAAMGGGGCGDAGAGGVTRDVETWGKLGEAVGSVEFDAGREGTCGFATTFLIGALIDGGCGAGIVMGALATGGVGDDVDFASEGFVTDALGFDRTEVDAVKTDAPNIERISALATSLGAAPLVFAAKAASRELGVLGAGADSGEPNSAFIRPANSGVPVWVLDGADREGAAEGAESAARIPI